jgi:putative endonuclease
LRLQAAWRFRLKWFGCERNVKGMLAEHLRQGRLGERIAGRFLIRQGFDILARRFRGRAGEVDLVGFEQETLVFVEVKTRASREFGDPWEFVDWQKQQSLRRVAEEFIARYDLGQYAYRFDIVSVLAAGTSEEEVLLLRNAF